ncbi:hypothetical protein PR003_g6877 [Phytophthora rubi]|uniref:Uncharacterized protein n=1 Tax=Phytophthora rubi TaxID=129364 RepID=A0A6A4G1E7_9STRA|nr:hypothetical protein PR003_g6877 [Phytophthora rubi]
MASCGWPAARFVVVAGVGGVANDGSVLILNATAASCTRDRRWWRRPRRGSHAAAPQQQAAWQKLVMASALAHSNCGCPAASCVVVGVSGSVAEAGGGVRAAGGNLPLPSRRFITPEVGRSWRY